MKDIISIVWLFLPMVSHWLLPEGIERSLYVNVLGLPVYIIDICYLFYLIKYKHLGEENKGCVPTSVKHSLGVTFFIYCIYVFFLGVVNNQDSLFLILIGDNWFFISAYIFLTHPLSCEMLCKTKWIIVPTVVIISLEVILFATGILTYTEDLGDQEYGGISRISTTIGAATGTAVILYMLGGIMLSVYKDLNSKIKWGLILLITVAIFFTVSRGSILAWSLFLAVFIYKNYLRNSRLSTKLYAVMVAILSLLVLNKYHVFDPVLERQNQLVTQDMVDTNRDYKVQETLRYYRESNYLGVGLGEIKVEKALEGKVNQTHNIGVHSFYYNTLGETGFLGFILVMIFLLTTLRNFDYKKDITYLSIIILVLTFSSEPIFVLAEYTSIVFFIFSISLNIKKNEDSVYML